MRFYALRVILSASQVREQRFVEMNDRPAVKVVTDEGCEGWRASVGEGEHVP